MISQKMCDPQHYDFVDLNLDFLDITPPAPTQGAPNATKCIVQSIKTEPKHSIKTEQSSGFIKNSKLQDLAKRIASTDVCVQQIQALQAERNALQQQLQELQSSANDVRRLYDEENQERKRLTCLSDKLTIKYDALQKEITNKTLSCDQLESELENFKNVPMDYNELVMFCLKLCCTYEEEVKPLYKPQMETVDKLKKYSSKHGLKIPETIKRSPKKRNRKPTRPEAGIQCEIWKMPPMPVETAIHVPPKEMRSQGTQHISTTTTRSTCTSTFIKKHNVGTNFPEASPLPPVNDIVVEMLKWDIRPLSPISEIIPAPRSEKEKIKKSTGTCTTICNIQRQIDYIGVGQSLLSSMKRSNSRPPSRNMFDGFKHELPTPPPSSPPSITPFAVNNFPHLGSMSSALSVATFEDLWQVFGQMLFGLLGNRPDSWSGAARSGNAQSQQEFYHWLRSMYADISEHRTPQQQQHQQPQRQQQQQQPPSTVDTSIHSTIPNEGLNTSPQIIDNSQFMFPHRNEMYLSSTQGNLDNSQHTSIATSPIRPTSPDAEDICKIIIPLQVRSEIHNANIPAPLTNCELQPQNQLNDDNKELDRKNIVNEILKLFPSSQTTQETKKKLNKMLNKKRKRKCKRQDLNKNQNLDNVEGETQASDCYTAAKIELSTSVESELRENGENISIISSVSNTEQHSEMNGYDKEEFYAEGELPTGIKNSNVSSINKDDEIENKEASVKQEFDRNYFITPVENEPIQSQTNELWLREENSNQLEDDSKETCFIAPAENVLPNNQTNQQWYDNQNANITRTEEQVSDNIKDDCEERKDVSTIENNDGQLNVGWNTNEDSTIYLQREEEKLEQPEEEIKDDYEDTSSISAVTSEISQNQENQHWYESGITTVNSYIQQECINQCAANIKDNYEACTVILTSENQLSQNQANESCYKNGRSSTISCVEQDIKDDYEETALISPSINHVVVNQGDYLWTEKERNSVVYCTTNEKTDYLEDDIGTLIRSNKELEQNQTNELKVENESAFLLPSLNETAVDFLSQLQSTTCYNLAANETLTPFNYESIPSPASSATVSQEFCENSIDFSSQSTFKSSTLSPSEYSSKNQEICENAVDNNEFCAQSAYKLAHSIKDDYSENKNENITPLTYESPQSPSSNSSKNQENSVDNDKFCSQSAHKASALEQDNYCKTETDILTSYAYESPQCPLSTASENHEICESSTDNIEYTSHSTYKATLLEQNNYSKNENESLAAFNYESPQSPSSNSSQFQENCENSIKNKELCAQSAYKAAYSTEKNYSKKENETLAPLTYESPQSPSINSSKSQDICDNSLDSNDHYDNATQDNNNNNSAATNCLMSTLFGDLTDTDSDDDIKDEFSAEEYKFQIPNAQPNQTPFSTKIFDLQSLIKNEVNVETTLRESRTHYIHPTEEQQQSLEEDLPVFKLPKTEQAIASNIPTSPQKISTPPHTKELPLWELLANQLKRKEKSPPVNITKHQMIEIQDAETTLVKDTNSATMHLHDVELETVHPCLNAAEEASSVNSEDKMDEYNLIIDEDDCNTSVTNSLYNDSIISSTDSLSYTKEKCTTNTIEQNYTKNKANKFKRKSDELKNTKSPLISTSKFQSSPAKEIRNNLLKYETAIAATASVNINNNSDDDHFKNYLNNILEDVAPPNVSPISIISKSIASITPIENNDTATQQSEPKKRGRKRKNTSAVGANAAPTAAIACKRSARLNVKRTRVDETKVDTILTPLHAMTTIKIGKYTTKHVNDDDDDKTHILADNKASTLDDTDSLSNLEDFTEPTTAICVDVPEEKPAVNKTQNMFTYPSTFLTQNSSSNQRIGYQDIFQSFADQHRKCLQKKKLVILTVQPMTSKELRKPDASVNCDIAKDDSSIDAAAAAADQQYESPASPETYTTLASPASPPSAITLETRSKHGEPKEIPLEPDPMRYETQHSSLLQRLIANHSRGLHQLVIDTFNKKYSNSIQAQLCARIKQFLNDTLDTSASESAAIQLVQDLHVITLNIKHITAAIVTELQHVPRPEVELACALADVPAKYLGKQHRRISFVMRRLQELQPNFTNELMAHIESTLFNYYTNENLPLAATLNLTQLYLLTLSICMPNMQKNPARLFVAKCLYYYNLKAVPMIYEVLCCFPTTLPHREERRYDRADALINVIQHLLMSTKYDMDKHDLRTKELLSKLRFEYHFEPFQPERTAVLTNLIEKIKADKLENVSYALALFCKRLAQPRVEADVLEAQLMPLANEYYQIVLHSSSHDSRIACLLECISMVIKPFRMDTNIGIYMSIFSRFLNVVTRATPQEAAVRAIIRCQRFGYVNCYNELLNFKPNYELQPITKAMLETFVYRKAAHFWRSLRN